MSAEREGSVWRFLKPGNLLIEMWKSLTQVNVRPTFSHITYMESQLHASNAIVSVKPISLAALLLIAIGVEFHGSTDNTNFPAYHD